MSSKPAVPQPEVIESQAIVVAPPEPPAMTVARPPQQVLAEAQEAARALAQVIGNKKKKVMFGGEQYLEYEDWLTIARFYGVTAKVDEAEYVEYGDQHGFKAHASAIMNPSGQVLSAAEALCLDSEPNWAKKPLFQLASMAQTRAAAKALRNVFSWVVVMAGYRPTPAEEMDSVIDKPPIQTPQRASARPAVPEPEPFDEPEPPTTARKISTKQRGMFWAKVHQYKLTDDQAKDVIRKYGVEKTDDLLASDFSGILAELQQRAGA